MGSKTRAAVLSLFLANPKGKFYVREVSRKTGQNLNAVHRELERLERVRILRSEKEANLKYYSINRTSPAYKELRSIFLKTEGVGKLLKEKIQSLGKIDTAFIYGSFARRKEKLGSDIDVLIVGQIDENALIKNINALEKKISRDINYVLFAPAEFKKRKAGKDPFLLNVLRAPKIKLIGE